MPLPPPESDGVQRRVRHGQDEPRSGPATRTERRSRTRAEEPRQRAPSRLARGRLSSPWPLECLAPTRPRANGGRGRLPARLRNVSRLQSRHSPDLRRRPRGHGADGPPRSGHSACVTPSPPRQKALGLTAGPVATGLKPRRSPLQKHLTRHVQLPPRKEPSRPEPRTH